MNRKMKSIMAILIVVMNAIFGMTLLWCTTGHFFNKTGVSGVVVLSLVEMFIAYKIVSKLKAESRLMASRLDSLVNQGTSFHVLLDSDSPNFELSKAVNRVESYQKERNVRYQIQNKNYLHLIEHLTVGIMQIDHKRQVLMANKTMDTFLGHHVRDQRHSYIDDIKTYQLSRLVEKTIKSREKQRGEIEIENTNRVVDVTVVYVENENLEFQVIVILYDITELKQLERMQNEFVGNVSHELKTPVTAIKGFTETLLAGPVDPETANKFLTIIYDESEKLEALIQEILKLAKGKKKEEAISSFDLGAVIDHELELLSNKIKNKNLTVEKKMEKDLFIEFDKSKIVTIIENLLQNAVKYNLDKGFVVIQAGIRESKIFISVSDTGIGISNEDKKRIFERFYRVDPSRNKQIEGNGLGLAIVQELVTSIGGKINVEDVKGGGTQITVYL
ncbi:sensor histidine kinase [Dellaglioa sp. BT-FLS60]